jgi:hypothetical protein
MLFHRLLKSIVGAVFALALGMLIGCASESEKSCSVTGEQVTTQSKSTASPRYPKQFNPKHGRAGAN